MTMLRGLAMFLIAAAVGCGLPGGDDGQLTISGRVAMATARTAAGVAPNRTVTHVMAVDPESASPHRSLAAVGADGSFTLGVEVGRPYVLVFVDATQVGPDMVVAVFRAGTLDTVSPQLAGHLELGDTMIDPTEHTASTGVSYDDLIEQLGLSPAAAEYLGAIDDLSLRYANPDIDGDGKIDITQDRRYALDFHVRANLRIGSGTGSGTGRNVAIDDVTDHFLADSGADVATPVFNLTSIYALYPASYDATEYVAQGAPGTALQHGAAFSATHADGSTPSAMTSFSGLGFGDTRGWGPDYNYESPPGLELPGSGGSPATLRYTLGAVGKTLTFTNVVTRTRASLTETGTLAIFVRLVSSGGQYTGIDYRWMKRASASSWVPATAEEIALTITGDGGHVSFHRAPSWHNEFGAQIPAQPSGSIAWTWQATGPNDVCGLAVSYDDKLGLRHFIGGADPNPGVSCTP
jgi:hypothetical protein